MSILQSAPCPSASSPATSLNVEMNGEDGISSLGKRWRSFPTPIPNPGAGRGVEEGRFLCSKSSEEEFFQGKSHFVVHLVIKGAAGETGVVLENVGTRIFNPVNPASQHTCRKA